MIGVALPAIGRRRPYLRPSPGQSIAWLMIALLLLVGPAARAADPVREVHGHSDAFAGHGIAIAWAVLRGATEESTSVVLKIATDPARYASVAIDGVDPFGGARQVRAPRTPLGSTIEVRIPRAQFADAPRTELRFLSASGDPRIIVYYLGVPDTTPEFADRARLDAFLSPRIADLALRAQIAAKP